MGVGETLREGDRPRDDKISPLEEAQWRDGLDAASPREEALAFFEEGRDSFVGDASLKLLLREDVGRRARSKAPSLKDWRWET